MSALTLAGTTCGVSRAPAATSSLIRDGPTRSGRPQHNWALVNKKRPARTLLSSSLLRARAQPREDGETGNGMKTSAMRTAKNETADVWVPVELGSKTFTSPQDLMSFFSSILNDAKTPLNEDLGDFIIMLEALRRHPKADKKIGCGVKSFQVRLSDEGYRHFVVVRVDETFDDLSFRKCVDVLFPGSARGSKNTRNKARDTAKRKSGGFTHTAGANVSSAPDPLISREAALNARISREATPKGLLLLIGEELDNFDHINVPTSLLRLGKLPSSPSMITDKNFTALLGLARDMCIDGRMQARGVANVIYALATMCKTGVLTTNNHCVFGALNALEERTRSVACEMTSQAVSNTVWGFATMKWELGGEAWDAIESAVIRLGPDEMNAQEVSNVLWGYAILGWELSENTWSALNTATARVAPDMNPQAIANTMWGFATLGRTPAEEALAALETMIVRWSAAMNTQDVANMLWSYVTLEVEPKTAPRIALESAVVRLGPEMNAQEVSNMLWGFSMLKGAAAGDEVLSALESAEVRLAPSMSAHDVSNTMLGYATYAWRRRPDESAWNALERALARVGPEMHPQTVSNTMWGYAALGRAPRGAVCNALEKAIARVGAQMDPQNVANTVYAYAKLGQSPGAAALASLDAATQRVAPNMNAQNVANTLWSFLSLVATRGLPLPACYPSLWRAARDLDTQSFLDVNWCNFFHAYLIHTELLAGAPGGGGDVEELAAMTFPSWIMHEAREEWMQNAFDNVSVSRIQSDVATVLSDLGVTHQMECLTEDEYFSLDMYLPDYDVAMEVDGPSHFIRTSTTVTGFQSTLSTELRNMFLRRRHRGLVTVPWFEFEGLEGQKQRREYIIGKLRAAGIDDIQGYEVME